MAFKTFTEMEGHLSELFQNKQYEKALEIVSREGNKFPEQSAWVDYWHMCAAARVKNNRLFFQIAENTLANGIWYGETIWRTTPSFEDLQGTPDFERIVSASKALREQETPSNELVLDIQLPENHSCTTPLLIALHGNEATIQNTLPFWQGCLAEGWALALPQSSQALYKGAYVWNDVQLAVAGMKEQWQQIQSRAVFDSKQVIIAGHSLGSLVAIQIALIGILKVSGFIAIGPVVPYLDEKEKLAALLTQARERNLHGYLIVGENDDDFFVEGSRTFFGMLQSAEIESRLEIVPGVAHTYAPAFTPALSRALYFVSRSA